MAQEIECLPSKYKTLNSNSCTAEKKNCLLGLWSHQRPKWERFCVSAPVLLGSIQVLAGFWIVGFLFFFFFLAICPQNCHMALF
jgi:hypothetical protein